MGPVIAVDGPAGVGKTSASRALARRLGYACVDTGAMYRAVGLLAREQGVALDDEAALAKLVEDLRFGFVDGGERLVVNGRDLSAAIRRGDAGELASRVSVRPAVRRQLVALQRGFAAYGGLVMEGRDIGTVVFPDAAVKVFLTAQPAERARRRACELRNRGETVDEAVLARDLAERDRRDRMRSDSPLRPAPDALVLDTTILTLEAVVDRMEDAARAHAAR